MFLKIIQLTAQGSFILQEVKSQEVYLQIQEISREPLHSMILLPFLCIFVQLPFAGAVSLIIHYSSYWPWFFFLWKLPKFIRQVSYFTELQLTLFALSKPSVDRSLSVVVPTVSSPLTNYSNFMSAFFILMIDLTKELNVSAILKSLIFFPFLIY